MVPILDAIPIPNFRAQLGTDGAFNANEGQQQAVAPVLNELLQIATALGPLRAGGTVAVREELLALERRRCAALVECNLDDLEKILALDLVHVHANGRVDNRGSYLDFVQHKLEFLAVRRGELQVSVQSGCALMSGPQTIVIRRPGEDGTGRTIDAFVVQCWALRARGWQQVSFQATALLPVAHPPES